MNDKKIMHHLHIIYPEQYPDEMITSDISGFSEEKLKIRIEKINYGAFCGIEWYLPTALVVFVLQPYFSGFLNEMGKDHYKKLKKGLKTIINFGKRTKYIAIAPDLSPDKLSKKYNQSLGVSIVFETSNSYRIKLLFDNDLDKVDWDNAIDQLFELVIENYVKFPDDRLSKIISKLESQERKPIFALINNTTKEIEFLNEKGMIIRFSEINL